MARYDVDGNPTTYQPSGVLWVQPEYRLRQDGSAVQSIYWSCELSFTGGSEGMPPAAFEEWKAFSDFGQHSIVLPPDDDALGADQLYSNVYIRFIDQPEYASVNTTDFAVLITPIEVT